MKNRSVEIIGASKIPVNFTNPPRPDSCAHESVEGRHKIRYGGEKKSRAFEYALSSAKTTVGEAQLFADGELELPLSAAEIENLERFLEEE